MESPPGLPTSFSDPAPRPKLRNLGHPSGNQAKSAALHLLCLDALN